MLNNIKRKETNAKKKKKTHRILVYVKCHWEEMIHTCIKINW